MRNDQALKQGLSWLKNKGEDDEEQISRLVLSTYPDRLGKARGKLGSFILANGRGAFIENDASLMQSPYIIAPEMTGSAQNTRIMAACSIDESDLYRLLGDELSPQIITEIEAGKSLKSRRVVKFGQLVLKESPLALDPTLDNALLLAKAIIDDLPLTKPQASLLTRLSLMAKNEPDLWPEAKLTPELLAPFILGKSSLTQITSEDINNALSAFIDYQSVKRLDQALPSHFTAPTGNQFLIDYEGEEPRLAIRVPELYGLKLHPTLGNGKIPLLIELLSPAYRPVQLTRDLIGFWQGSYKDVRIEMKGRYPRHPWPEDPMEANATARAKPRGT
jgi:ATP-dependent helicase HrpB